MISSKIPASGDRSLLGLGSNVGRSTKDGRGEKLISVLHGVEDGKDSSNGTLSRSQVLST